MGIAYTFDDASDEIISPKNVIPEIDNFPEVIISVFSQKFNDLLLNTVEVNQIDEMTGGRKIPIYKFVYGGKEIGFYHTLLGGSASGALLEEVIAKGGKKILFFGSCGSLDKEITAGHLIIPVEAYRDEGTSYHYASASDYIKICSAEKLSQIFNLLKVPYIKTKTWTTDSFYRETQKNVEARKNDGCKVVEMECASIMAVGQFRGVEVYQFLYAADCLDESVWDKRILGNMPNTMRQKLLKIALETAIRL